MNRRFDPRDHGWSPSIPSSQILLPNRSGTYYNIEASDGGVVPDMIGMYVDGAARGIGTNSERAGIGVHWGRRSRYNVSRLLPDNMAHTSQRAELYAATVAVGTIMNIVSKTTTIDTNVIVSDSQYLVNGITEYIYGWMRNGWITTMGGPVKNRDMWEYLHFLLDHLLDERGINIMFWKCDRNENEEADALAGMAVE